MSFVKILEINTHFLSIAASNDFVNELNQLIEGKLHILDDIKGLPYSKPDIVQLISSIEKDKIRFLRAGLSAKQLYTDVASKLSKFKVQHPRFDYLNDPALNIYFS